MTLFVSKTGRKLLLISFFSALAVFSAVFAGDITYYSPWGNLAIFYRDFGYARGLIIMGKLDSDAGVLKECREPCTVTFERIDAE